MLLQRFQRTQASTQGLHPVAYLVKLVGRFFAATTQGLDIFGSRLGLRGRCGIFLRAGLNTGLKLIDFLDGCGGIESIQLALQAQALLFGALHLAFDMLDTAVFDLRRLVNLVEFTSELIPQFLPLVHFIFRLRRRCLLLLEILIAGFKFWRNIG